MILVSTCLYTVADSYATNIAGWTFDARENETNNWTYLFASPVKNSHIVAIITVIFNLIFQYFPQNLQTLILASMCLYTVAWGQFGGGHRGRVAPLFRRA